MAEVAVMQSPPGPEVTINGMRYLYFGGTSYLGLAWHPEVLEAGCRAIRDFGVHSATTRAGFGTNPPVQAVERNAAEFFGTEDAFYFSSGYVAPQIIISVLAPHAEVVLLDEAAHFSARDAVKLSGLPAETFRAGDPDDLVRAARRHKCVLVVADAVGPATGLLSPVRDYMRRLDSLDRAILLLDDAHGFGVLGDRGRGLLEELGLWPGVNKLNSSGIQLCVCGTLSKAFGGFGGLIPGSHEFVNELRVRSNHFCGASAPPSAAAGSTAKALELALKEPFRRERLRENAGRLRQGLKTIGIFLPKSGTAHFGVNLGDAANMRRIHEGLKARGILLPFIEAYSGLPPEGVLRFAVFADHTAQQIDRLLAELRQVL